MTQHQVYDLAFSDRDADALLTGLVERYSPSGKESPATSYLVDRMLDLGFRAGTDAAGNAVGELGEGERTILLLGHIDTVPGFIDVRKEDDLLYGRGTVDAKGPLAAFVAAAARAGIQPGKRIVVVGAVEEEAATSKGARFLLGHSETIDSPPDAVIIGEPSRWNQLTIGYKGRLLLDYALSREIGHTAGPGKSPCEVAVGFWQQVEEYAHRWNRNRDGVFEQLSPSLRQICSGDNAFIDTVAMTIGLRLPLGIDAEALQARLVALAGDAELRFRGYEVAFRAPKNTHLVRSFIKAIRAERQHPVFKVKSGTSDMNVVGPAWNCPVLAYGPGDASLDHTPHEHIDLHEYHQAIKVLTTVLEDL